MSVAQLQPWLQPYAQAMINAGARYGLVVTSTYRSPTKQLELWHNRHTNPYPVAPPGTSYHEYGRAWDMVGPPEVLEAFGRYWNSIGGKWSPSDRIHFQA